MDHGAIVVGGGHNGLITATYLARAGIDTVVVEARASVGGCASTVEDLGACFNICNCDHQLFRSTPIMEELGLAGFGLRYLDTSPNQLHATWDGGAPWAIFHELDRTIDVLKATYPGEVDGYRRYLASARPVAELVVEMANGAPTPRHVLATLADRRARGVATLLRWSKMTAAQVLRSFFREEAMMGPVVTTGPAVWGKSAFSPGTGTGVVGYALKHVVRSGRPVGGSGAVPASVRAAFEAHGGAVRTASTVSAVLCSHDRVRGVELTDGTVIEAPIVVSACDPAVLFVRWLRDPPRGASEVISKYRDRPLEEGYESKIDAVIGELPHLRSVDVELMAKLGIDPSTPTTIVSPPLQAIDDAHRAMARGAVTERPMFFMNTPSVLDPTMTPAAGGHVFSLEVLYTPYRLKGGWDTSGEPRRWLEAFASLVQPGWMDSVRAWRAMTPNVYERDFHLLRGHAPSFVGSPIRALLGRDRELTRYETPVRGLYLTGAATFPGAGVWGAPGRNAARVILAAHH